jgi:hypothetical protein
MNQLANEDYFSLIDDITEEETCNQELESNITEALNSTRRLYWTIQEAKAKNIKLRNEYSGVLNTAIKYAMHSSLEFNKDGQIGSVRSKNVLSSCEDWVHKLYKRPNQKVGYNVKPLFTSLPLVRFEEIKSQWGNFIEIHTSKVLFALLSSVLTLIFGGFSILSYVLIVMAVGHTLMRVAANKNKNQDNYLNTSKNAQLFLWPFFLLAMGNTLSYIIVINVFPEGTMLAFFIAWLIWAEMRGIVDK